MLSTLADIVPTRAAEMSQSIATQLQATDGKNVLFILDGWDEFPHQLMENESSLVSTILYRPFNLSLHQSTVLITSRPVSSGNLLHITNRRIEILGFTRDQIREYIHKALDDKSTLIQKLVGHLENHPVIEGYCYIPLHVAILVHIFLTMKGALPTTRHELFCSLVLCCIVREHETHEPDKPLPELSSLDDLPDDLKTKLNQLSVLAYNGVMQNKIIFYSKDLLFSSVPIKPSSLGLLQAVEGLTITCKSLSYNFLHLSVQELLAAYNISLMDPSEQVRVFERLFESSRFEPVLQYCSGFTKLSNPSVQEFISSFQHKKSHLKDLLPLLHCFYEAHQPSLCLLVDRKFDECKFGGTYLQGENAFDCQFPSPVDHLAVGYFISSIVSTSATRLRRVKLSYKLFEDQHGLMLLLSELSKYPINGINVVAAASRIVKLSISGVWEESLMKRNGVRVLHVVEAFPKNSFLTQLHLFDSIPECYTQRASSVFSKMLTNNKSLKLLKISTSNYFNIRSPEISRSAVEIFHGIIEGLQHNTTLETLSFLYYNITATDPDIARSLTEMLLVNKSLTHLDLSHNSLSDSGACCIFKGLQHNTALVKLSLEQNNITATDPDTARYFTKMLQVNKSLTHLDLSFNQFGNPMVPCVLQLYNAALDYIHDSVITDDNAECIFCRALKSYSTSALDDLEIVLSSDTIYSCGVYFILDSLLHYNAFRELRVTMIDSGLSKVLDIARQEKQFPTIHVVGNFQY